MNMIALFLERKEVRTSEVRVLITFWNCYRTLQFAGTFTFSGSTEAPSQAVRGALEGQFAQLRRLEKSDQS